MQRKIVVAFVVLLGFWISFLGKKLLKESSLVRVPGTGKGLPEEVGDSQIQRIVSMAPSITETLFALGLGEKVVGG